MKKKCTEDEMDKIAVFATHKKRQKCLLSVEFRGTVGAARGGESKNARKERKHMNIICGFNANIVKVKNAAKSLHHM